MTPGVVVYRLDDRLFLANASYVRGRVHEALRGASTVTTALVLNAEAITHIDSAGLHALEDLALGKDGIALHFARAKHLIRPDHRACVKWCPLPRLGPRGRARRCRHHPVGVMPAACAAVRLRG